jgi:sugar phosphate isomerase/epimerase
MRIGTTSYIVPADMITNVRHLAGRVADVELLFLEVDDHWNRLPEQETIHEIARLGGAGNMSFTVHLPLDVRPGAENGTLGSAVAVIRRTRALSPWGFVLHLDGVDGRTTRDEEASLNRVVRAIELLGREAGAVEAICVENIEGRPTHWMDFVLARSGASCCADVGHLWKDGVNPVPLLEAWLPRLRIVHLHGVAHRDHVSLSLTPEEQLDAVVDILSDGFAGVVTLEIFSEADLLGSLEAVQMSMERVTAVRQTSS